MTGEGAYDLVIIGSGPGGYVAAIRAGQLGLRAALVEQGDLGGVCLNAGCIPAKTLLRSAEVLSTVHEAADFGVHTGPVSFDLAQAQRRKAEVVKALRQGVKGLLRKNKVALLRGHGSIAAAPMRIEGPVGSVDALGEVRIQAADGSETRLSTRNIVLATGSAPRPLPGVPFDGTTVLSTAGALALDRLPRRLAVLGAGPGGVEFAYLFRRLGAEQVILVEALPQLLPREDAEIAALVHAGLARRGIRVEVGARLADVEPINPGTAEVDRSVALVDRSAALVDRSVAEGDRNAAKGDRSVAQGDRSVAQGDRSVAQGDPGVRFRLTTASGAVESLEVDCLLVSIGVRPVTDGLGLEEAGVLLDPRGYVLVDETMRTSAPGVWAVGDVTPTPPLANVASAEGIAVVERIAGLHVDPLDYDKVPRGVYCQPEVGAVGLTEAQARERGYDVRVGRFPFRSNGRALLMGQTEGLVKVVSDARYGEILGVHLFGPEATTLLGEAGLALAFEYTDWELGRASHAHPTLAECLQEAALAAAGRAIHG